jgi:hypothetical protein
MGIHKKPSSGQTPRRAYYPSGPWIDGIRPPGDNPASEPSPENPDPNNYHLVAAEENGPYLIVMIKYPNCSNFEGNKILVYKDLNLIALVNQKLIDPHFFKDAKYASPIARFVPTTEGWKMAQVFVAGMRVVENKV